MLSLVLTIGAMSAAGILVGCSCVGVGDLEQGEHMPGKTIRQVQEEHTPDWMAIPGVEGTAIGLSEGKPCIKILASVKPEKLRSEIPSSVEGYPVVVEETGIFRLLGQPKPTASNRPKSSFGSVPIRRPKAKN